jgi:uncharacterized protein (TIGR04255 family)
VDQTVLDFLQLPDVPRIELERPPLVMALCQVQYDGVPAIEDAAFIAPFQAALREEYPIPAIHPRAIQLGLNAEGFRQQVTSIQWVYRDQEDTWRVVLAQDAVTIETRIYKHFSDFLDRLRAVLMALSNHIKPDRVTRIGLRYINEIGSNDAAWSAIITPTLLGPLRESTLAMHTLQVIQEMRLQYPDNQGILIRHGHIPQGTTVRPRQGETPSARPFYLLDFDVFRECPGPEALPLDPELICQHVTIYHQGIYRLFRWAVTTDYINSQEAHQHE